MSYEKIIAFQCGVCDELYETERQAQFCCLPLTVEAFLCSCGAVFYNELAAAVCCPVEGDEYA
jgi:hypothetical protein